MTSQTRTSITVEIVSPGPSRATIEARPERAADRAPAHGRTSLPPRGPVGCCRRGTRRPRRLIGKCRAGAAAGNVSAEGEAIRSNDYRKDTTVKATSTRPAAVLGLDVGKSSHWACLIDRGGEVLASAPVRNREAELDALFSSAPAGTLVVVDQFRNIGSLAVRRARAAGLGVAHLPGLAASRAAGLFAGEAKTDERDAAVIARTAPGVPDSLSGVPGRGEALEAARALSSQRDHVVACATRDKNLLRAVLLESCPALEAADRPVGPAVAGAARRVRRGVGDRPLRGRGPAGRGRRGGRGRLDRAAAGARRGREQAGVSVNLFFASFANQTRRSHKGGFTGCANVFSPIPVTP